MKSLIVPEVSGWEQIGEFASDKVATLNWPGEFPYAPQVEFSIAHTPKSLLLEFRVVEQDARAVCKTPNGPVWEDSCVEFFVKDPQSEYYFNFETNSIGTPLVGKRKSRKECEHFSVQKLAMIERQVSDIVDGQWTLRLSIPFTCLDIEGCPSTLSANFYKCGDKTAVAHFLSWNPIDTPTPDFHRPEFFGELLLA